MDNLSDRLYAQARITPIRPQRRVQRVEKLADGALRVWNQGGESYDIAADDAQLQAFVVYTVLQDAAST